MGGAHRPASCIWNVSFPTWGVAKHSCYFLELRQGEVRHSRGPDGPGPPARRWPYRRTLLVVSAHTEDRDGGGLRASGGAMRRAGAATPRPDKRRAMGRIEHKLLVGDGHPNRPKTFTRSPLNPTIPQKVTNVSIYHKGSEPSRLKAPTHDRSRYAEHGGCSCTLNRRVRAPPGIVILAPPEVPRNAERAPSEGRASQEGCPNSAAEDSIKAGAPKDAPARSSP
jgi:hypothetical protein